MTYYGIRHVRTGELLPSFRGKGSSYWNPDVPENFKIARSRGTPRLFPQLRHVKAFITEWSKGAVYIRYEFDGFDGLDYKPDGRKKEDLEIVEFELFLKVNGKNEIVYI